MDPLRPFINRLADALASRLERPLAEAATRGDRRLLTTKQLADRLALSERTARKLLAEGAIPSLVVADAARRVDALDADAYIEQRKALDADRPPR